MQKRKKTLNFLVFGFGFFLAQSLVAENASCPMFHCNPEATTVVYKGIVPTIAQLTNSNLGQLKAQGCSSDSIYMACLYFSDTAVGLSKGTLKVLNTETMTPVWGSAGATQSYELNPLELSPAQVPVFLGNNKIAAGDSSRYVRYNLLTGQADPELIELPGASVMGFTPVSSQLGILTLSDGKLILIDFINWKKLDQIQLVDPLTQEQVKPVSPSSGSDAVLYAVVSNRKNKAGYLLSVTCDLVTKKLQQKNFYAFNGTSGASAVVVKPIQSGLEKNLVLFHAPLSSDLNQSSMNAVVDNGDSFSLKWRIPLAAEVQVTPTIDENSKSLFYQLANQSIIYKNSYLDGGSAETFDIKSLGRFPQSFKLNGHMAASQAEGVFTLLLAGSVARSGDSAGQFILSVSADGPGKIIWSKRISKKADSYTAAWNFTPSKRSADKLCPIIVGYTSGITKLCDE